MYLGGFHLSLQAFYFFLTINFTRNPVQAVDIEMCIFSYLGEIYK